MLALILAGGRGLRLSPYTRVLPKPLLPVGDRPVLAILLERLRLAGVRHAVLALGYLGELIQTYFGEGRRVGLEISYLHEEEPLGTAGPVARLPRQAEPFFVVNGDILTDLSFAELLRYHIERGAAATIAACRHEVRLEYGMLHAEDGLLAAWEEKPVLAGLISMGAYVLAPEAQAACPRGRIEMPSLLGLLLASGLRVAVAETDAYWRDIGTPEEYKEANQNPPDFAKGSGVLDAVGTGV